jgi:hypothetical protein
MAEHGLSGNMVADYLAKLIELRIGSDTTSPLRISDHETLASEILEIERETRDSSRMDAVDVDRHREAITQSVHERFGRIIAGRNDLESLERSDGLPRRERELRIPGIVADLQQDRLGISHPPLNLIDHQTSATRPSDEGRTVVPVVLSTLRHEMTPKLGSWRVLGQQDRLDIVSGFLTGHDSLISLAGAGRTPQEDARAVIDHSIEQGPAIQDIHFFLDYFVLVLILDAILAFVILVVLVPTSFTTIHTLTPHFRTLLNIPPSSARTVYSK